MINISADIGNLSIPKSLGNHFLNFSFACSLAKNHGYSVSLPRSSDIESIATPLVRYIKPDGYDVWSEKTAFAADSLLEATKLSKDQQLRGLRLLSTGVKKDTIVSGNFWHIELHSPEIMNEFLSFRTPKEQASDNTVCVHYRGTDFTTHLLKFYPQSICLPTEYYERAITLAKKKLGNAIKFLVFTDDPKKAIDTLPRVSYDIVEADAAESWLMMKNARNIICSNSTFCWTASLFNKEFIIMPQGGLNHKYTGILPAGFKLLGAFMI